MLWLIALVAIAVSDDRSSVSASIWLGRSFAFASTCVLGLYLADLYDIAAVRRASQFCELLPRAVTIALCMLAVLYALWPSSRMGMVALLNCMLFAVGLLFPLRAMLGRLVRRQLPERVLVLGGGRLATNIMRAAEAHGEHVIVGVLGLASDASFERVSDQPVLWSADDLNQALHACQPERVIVAAADRRVTLPLRALQEGRLHGIAVEDGVTFYERVAGKIPLELLSPRSVAFGDSFGEQRLHAAFARAIGLVASLLGLIVLSPLLLLLCLAVRLSSPGPVFFVQQRVGRHEKPFGLIKLRTMYVSNDTSSEWAGDNRHRVTPLGRFLRRYRIDELPQLINVLRGDMNLVGPRPHPVTNHALFQQRIPHYALRSVVRPGITGWAQVRYGYADNLEEEIEKMRFDLFYIRNVSIWLDLDVLVETLWVVLRGQERAPGGRRAITWAGYQRERTTPQAQRAITLSGSQM